MERVERTRLPDQAVNISGSPGNSYQSCYASDPSIDTFVSVSSSLCTRQMPRRRINEWSVTSAGSFDAIDTPSSHNETPALTCGDASMKLWRRASVFIESLKDQAQSQGNNVVDLISGEEGKSVLKRLYAHDDKLALALLEKRLQAYDEIYSDPERLGIFDSEEGTAQEQDIYEMLWIVDLLKKEKDEAGFSRLIHLLNVFEEQEKRVPFESRYNLALLKRAGIVYKPAMQAMPARMASHMIYLLEPADVSETTGYLWAQHSADEIPEAVHKLCLAEGKRYQEVRLHHRIKSLFETAQLDLERFTVTDNIRRLCESNPIVVWKMVDAFYKEEARKNSEVINPLKHYDKKQKRSSFLLELLDNNALLSQWVSGPLTHHLLRFEEDKLVDKLQNKGNDDAGFGNASFDNNSFWLCRLAGFVRQAEAANYPVNDSISDQLKVLQLEKMQHYISRGMEAEPPLWLIGGDMTADGIKAQLSARSPDKLAHCYQALKTYITVSQGVKSLEEEKQMFQAKDTLLKAQIEYLFACARRHIDHQETLKQKPKAVFDDYLHHIGMLENLRPPGSLLKKAINFSQVVGAIGCYLIRGGEVPVSQRLRDISLEYQLKYHFAYNFKTEVTTQLSSIPGQFCVAAKTIAEQAKRAVNLIYKTVSGNICLSDACKESIMLPQGASSAVLDSISQQLNDYATLCEHHPYMARVLAGNIAQTLAVIENTVGTGSEIYCLFNQFKKRIGMEAMASYMTEQFEVADMDISQLDPEKAAALKRMFALCQLFQWAPEAVIGTTGAVKVAGHAASGSAIGVACSTVKTALRMAATHMVKQGVSTLSDEDVQGINAAIMAWQHGPKEAALRLQAMQTATAFMADQAKGCSVTYSVVKAFFRPLLTRFTRAQQAYQQWRYHNKSRWRLISEVAKLAAVVLPVVGSAIATPAVAIALSPVFIGYTMTLGPVLSLACLTLFYQMDPGEDFARLVSNKVSALLEPGMEGVIQRARQEAACRLQAGGYRLVKRRMAYEALYMQYWPDFAEKHQALVETLEAQFEQDKASDNEYQEQIKRLQAMVGELKQLESLLVAERRVRRQYIVSCVPQDVGETIPRDDARAIYWATLRIQLIREILFQKLGTDIIPENGEILANRLHLFEKRLAMVEFMRQNKPEIDGGLLNATKNVERRVEAMIQGLHEQAYLLSSRVAMKQAILAMAGDGVSSQDQLERLISRRQVFEDRINSEFEAMKQVYKTQG